MAYTEKRKHGYIGRFRAGYRTFPTVKDEHGATLYFKRRVDAQRAADDKEADVRGKRYEEPAALRGTTFGAWVNDWYARQNLAPRTMQSYQRNIETILLPEFEDDPLIEITTPRVSVWERRLADDGYRPDSVRTYRGLLHVIMADAAAEGLIDANPVTRPRGRGRRAGKAMHRRPEKPVVDSLGAVLLAERCAVLTGRDDDFILVVAKAWTGARWGELVGLERDYFRMSTLRIEWQLAELDDGTWLRCPPKEDSRRTIDIPPFLADLFSRQLQATHTPRTPTCTCHRPGKQTPAHPGGTHVFTGRATRRRKDAKPVTAAHWRRSGFESMIFKPAAEGWYPKKAPLPRRPVPVTADPFPGLPVRGRNYVERSDACWLPIAEGLHPHLLRHSHKTWMSEDRIPEILSHERLGHELGGVGARYTHVTQAMRQDLIDALTERWHTALDERLKLSPTSPTAILNDLLGRRRAQKDVGRPEDRPTDVPLDEISRLRARPRKRA